MDRVFVAGQINEKILRFFFKKVPFWNWKSPESVRPSSATDSPAATTATASADSVTADQDSTATEPVVALWCHRSTTRFTIASPTPIVRAVKNVARVPAFSVCARFPHSLRMAVDLILARTFNNFPFVPHQPNCF